MKHTFAISAYRESPYLEACIRSLKAQTEPAEVILCTSTPNRHIRELAEKYSLPLFVRKGQSQIQDDWNFAVEMAAGGLVTIAHQDDLYHKDYAALARSCWERYPDTTVMMTDAVIIRNGRLVLFDIMNLIKKVLRMPLRASGLGHLKWIKKSSLLFGNPIICPSCTYSKNKLSLPVFTSAYEFALDWETMLKLAEFPGRWVLIERPLIYYRVHSGSATKALIQNHTREREEQEMFQRLWPKWVAGQLMKLYRLCYKSYD